MGCCEYAKRCFASIGMDGRICDCCRSGVVDRHNSACVCAVPHQNEPLQSTANLYEGSYLDGKYIGAAIGYNGRLKVAVFITDGKISECRLTATVEDEPYQTRATDSVFAEAIRTNAVNIDSLSGATSTADRHEYALPNCSWVHPPCDTLRFSDAKMYTRSTADSFYPYHH